MADNLTDKKRSKIMASIKSKDTKIEKKVRSALWYLGYRYRLHQKVEGKPDVVFLNKKIAIFCDGCFWHGCPKCYKRPKSNQEYWDSKISKNIKRAIKVNKQLEDEGWTVLRFWAHEINEDLERVIIRIREEYAAKK